MMTTLLRNPVWGLSAALLLVGALVGSSSAAGPQSQSAQATAGDVSQQLQALVQADWIAQDERFQAAQGIAQSFSPAHTRQIVDRAEHLLDRLRADVQASSLGLAERLDSLGRELGQLRVRVERMDPSGTSDSQQARGELYFAARRLLRQIAFCNPRLQFDKLLFIKRHAAGGPFHMCDQFYGCNARPGGGLFVLHDPFGPRPRLENLLEDAVVQRGRLAGETLAGGSFLSPELSFDARTILFAYSEAKATGTYQWAPEYSYHIFRVRADGRGLEQLTDGPWDDFDPCFLPGGRVVFISTRRGGYLRCGRHCPVYTMFSMEPDGSDVRCLSFHETHEWQPSVDHQGMLVYTRWDYVDRDTNIAHHLWTCNPDGSDPRSYHGNYPLRRESRPWMEMSIRAVPGSSKYVAVTGAHHGHAFGSLVLVDLRGEDDRAMAQLERLTPEVPFPEAEGRPITRYMVYATPWPLGEDDYLCAYDPEAKNHGIYWIDRFGNHELLYRDPEIACLDPIPLRPRPRPPVLPERTLVATSDPQGAKPPRPANATAAQMGVECKEPGSAVSLMDVDGSHPATDPADGGTASVGVMNVYDSDFAWPPGTRVTALRIIQLLPKTTPPPNQPRIGVANQSNARAVLGTVPVEADGSAYFEAPAGKAIYFQALDEQGLAVQSMRSVTYALAGQRLFCQGCHERKRHAPAAQDMPLALRRAPSQIQPDVEGSHPFSYVRLVQPVLDRHCVECHQQRGALNLSGEPDGSFNRSYNNLAGKYAFYFHVSNGSIRAGVHGGSRTVPGAFGARAAPLMDYLREAHYGVSLPQEDFHRVTLWLDCNSEFLGAYEDAPAQARGETVWPSLD